MPESAQDLWEMMETEAQPYLDRAEKAAQLTIPHLLPPEGSSSSTTLPTPFQSVGARGVNNLASKLLQSLFAPAANFVRWDVDDALVEDAIEQQGGTKDDADGIREEVRQAAALGERRIRTEFEVKGHRVALFEHIRHLVVIGNGLLREMDDGKYRHYSLRQYRLRRDPTDDFPSVIVLREAIDPTGPHDNESRRYIWTVAKRQPNKKYRFWQEEDPESNQGNPTPSKKTFPRGTGDIEWVDMPLRPGRMMKVSGEAYGRAYAEEYLGDLQTLEGLSQAVVDGAVNASTIRNLVNPMGVTSLKDLATAPNGAWRPGRGDDISQFRQDKGSDFQFVVAVLDQIRHRLELAFLLNSSIQRNAERVTATEVNRMVQDLEDALGGAFTQLTESLQLPIVRMVIHRMEKEDRLPKFPEGVAEPRVVGGIEALGRGHNVLKFQQWSQIMLQTFGPEALTRQMHVGPTGAYVANELGLDLSSFVKSQEEVQAEIQQEQQAAMMQQMAPEVTKAAVNQPGGNQ